MSCLILNPEDLEQFQRAVSLLRSKDVVALPTETVYGLAACLSSEEALARIFTLKARPTFDPLIVHVTGISQARSLVMEWTPLHQSLAELFWPGPLTLLAPKNPRFVSDLCTAGSPLVALRSPKHPVFESILEALGEPLAAPSANRFGRISPTTAEDVVTELGPWGLEAVVEGGSCAQGVESTIVRVISDNELEVIRPGALSLEALRVGLGESVNVRFVSRSVAAAAAPGQLESHYAPRTPLYFLERGAAFDELPTLVREALPSHALLTMGPELSGSGFPSREVWGRHEVLSPNGSDLQAAARLFSVLRTLDGAGYRGIVACAGLDAGLGLALNDRLRRAGAGTRGAQ